MCGRFVLARADADLVALFGVDQVAEALPAPSYNIAPSEPVKVVREADPPAGRRLEVARWGLVPSFYRSRSGGPTPFNARIEKVATGGLYRRAFAHRRLIVPADGFYERSREAGRPSFFVTPGDGSILALAGLGELWRDPNQPQDQAAPWLASATIVTHAAQGAMAPIHDREPLYLTEDLWADWLDPATSGTPALLAAVEAASAEVAQRLVFRRVGPAWLTTVPGRKRDDAGLIAASV